MKERHTPVIRIILMDLLLLNAIFIFFACVIKKINFHEGGNKDHYLTLLIVSNFLWIFINVIITKYSMEINRGIILELKKNFINIALFTGLISAFAFALKDFAYSRILTYGTILTFFIFLLLSHLLFFYLFLWFKRISPLRRKVLIVGDDHSAIELSTVLKKDSQLDYEVVVYILSEELENKVDNQLVVGKVPEIETILQNDTFDQLFIVVSSYSEKDILKIVEYADYYGIRVRMVPAFYRLFEKQCDVHLVNHIPIININETPLDRYYNSKYKSVFDLFFSIFAIILTLPLLILIAIAVKLTSKGPILYKAGRVGKGGKVFNLLKFRTMYHPEINDDTQSTSKNDPRITPIGRILRKINLDELPQFFNVAVGQMSVVGPRPHRIYLDNKLQHEVSQYMIRHYIKPGITGWAQVNGWRGPTEKNEQKIQRTRHDLWYIKNWSFWLDIKIIFLTLFGKKARQNAF